MCGMAKKLRNVLFGSIISHITNTKIQVAAGMIECSQMSAHLTGAKGLADVQFTSNKQWSALLDRLSNYIISNHFISVMCF